jgi:predicted lipid-binding transport protein (Tim44 family)
MPQDTDGSGLILLLWIAWIYWWIYRSLNLMSVSHSQGYKLRQSGGTAAAGCADAPLPALIPTGSHRLEDAVSEILRRDGATTLDDFLARAATAYEAIVTAFNAGDRDTLWRMLSSDVYDVFCDALAAAETEGEDLEIVFSRIEPPEIVDAFVGDTIMTISLRFIADFYALPRHAPGHATGDEPVARRTVDVWTFERTTASGTASWRVAATGTDAP